MIQRYQEFTEGAHIHEHDLGDYVKYEDHRALLDKAHNLIKEAYQAGKKAGARQEQSRHTMEAY